MRTMAAFPELSRVSGQAARYGFTVAQFPAGHVYGCSIRLRGAAIFRTMSAYFARSSARHQRRSI